MADSDQQRSPPSPWTGHEGPVSPEHLQVQQPCAQTTVLTLKQFLLPLGGFQASL